MSMYQNLFELASRGSGVISHLAWDRTPARESPREMPGRTVAPGGADPPVRPILSVEDVVKCLRAGPTLDPAEVPASLEALLQARYRLEDYYAAVAQSKAARRVDAAAPAPAPLGATTVADVEAIQAALAAAATHGASWMGAIGVRDMLLTDDGLLVSPSADKCTACITFLREADAANDGYDGQHASPDKQADRARAMAALGDRTAYFLARWAVPILVAAAWPPGVRPAPPPPVDGRPSATKVSELWVSAAEVASTPAASTRPASRLRSESTRRLFQLLGRDMVRLCTGSAITEPVGALVAAVNAHVAGASRLAKRSRTNADAAKANFMAGNASSEALAAAEAAAKGAEATAAAAPATVASFWADVLAAKSIGGLAAEAGSPYGGPAADAFAEALERLTPAQWASQPRPELHTAFGRYFAPFLARYHRQAVGEDRKGQTVWSPAYMRRDEEAVIGALIAMTSTPGGPGDLPALVAAFGRQAVASGNVALPFVGFYEIVHATTTAAAPGRPPKSHSELFRDIIRRWYIATKTELTSAVERAESMDRAGVVAERAYIAAVTREKEEMQRKAEMVERRPGDKDKDGGTPRDS